MWNAIPSTLKVCITDGRGRGWLALLCCLRAQFSKMMLKFASCPPFFPGQRMLYEPTDHLDAARLPEVVQGLQSQDVLLDEPRVPLEDSSRVTRSVKDDKRREHMADVAMAALYLACGGKYGVRGGKLYQIQGVSILK